MSTCSISSIKDGRLPVKQENFEQPAFSQNLASLIADASKKTPDAIAIIEQESSYTYLELFTLIQNTAQTWRGILSKTPNQNPVALLMENTLDFVVHYFALLGLGQTVIPLNYRLTSHEVAVILNDAQACHLISDAEHINRLVEQEQTVLPYWQSSFQEPTIWLVGNSASNLPDGRCRWFTAIEPTAGMEGTFPIAVKDNTLATLIYTSGTTGKPKGVMLSHQNILADAWGNAQAIKATEKDVFITISPLFHVFGQTNVLCTAMMAGASLVLVNRFAPKRVLEAIERHQVTFMAAVPTMYQMMLAQMRERQYDLSSLRVCHSGAAPMSVALFHEVEDAFGAPVQEGYGLSEASSIITSNPLEGKRKPGSVGLPLSNAELKVIDEDGNMLSTDEIGELCVRGPMVMQGYHQRAELTDAVLRHDGWLRTGDMASIDADGYIFLLDRRDDLINIGGIKVYPREIEEVLYRHPDVASVAVVGIQSERFTHRPKAFIVLQPGSQISAQTLKRHCRTYLSAYKVPTAVEFVDEIPKGATGKILRKSLRS